MNNWVIECLTWNCFRSDSFCHFVCLIILLTMVQCTIIPYCWVGVRLLLILFQRLDIVQIIDCWTWLFWKLCNISNTLYSNDCDNDNVICLNQILYNNNKMTFVFYYYVKIYLRLCISYIWCWITIYNIYILFGIFDCVFWGNVYGMHLYDISVSNSYSF